MLTPEQRRRFLDLLKGWKSRENLCQIWVHDRELLVAELESCRKLFGAPDLAVPESEVRRIEKAVMLDIALLDAVEGRAAGSA